ncbi:hypothetical protein LAZ67_5000502 [Cordylochernes scorpioides]|uniref:Integrase catalytic domain-containing protein n=1 Tax=Cordylochernes scorpioides TaxID=51811 RepID=A0ABY6KF40_9ARAC|nr:hypothetical protein LAZ67_5000502 [Cordylochernes scorpioides]
MAGWKKDQLLGGDLVGYLQDKFNPPEMHLPGYNYCGPFTKLSKRLARGDKGKNRVDEACKKHDIAYSQTKDTKERHVADQILLDEINSIENPTFGEKAARFVINPIIKTKKRFGLGISKMIWCLKCKKKTKTSNEKESKDRKGRKRKEGICCKKDTENQNEEEYKTGKLMMKAPDEKSLEEIYYNPETGYTGINDLIRKSGKSQKEVREFLHKQDVYTRHKPIIRKFERRRVYVSGIDDQWQADLVDMQNNIDRGSKYILTVIDIFSKYAWAVPIKYKSGNEIVEAFSLIFKERLPDKIQTDKGKEFINKNVQNLFKKYKIKFITTESEMKAQVVERFNGTLRGRMEKYFKANKTKKWFNVLGLLIKNYNSSYHRSIKMTPIEASKKENESKVYRNLFGKTVLKIYEQKFKVGDKVRIYAYKGKFTKGSKPNFTREVFEISEVLKTAPITYKIKDQKD